MSLSSLGILRFFLLACTCEEEGEEEEEEEEKKSGEANLSLSKYHQDNNCMYRKKLKFLSSRQFYIVL